MMNYSLKHDINQFITYIHGCERVEYYQVRIYIRC